MTYFDGLICHAFSQPQYNLYRFNEDGFGWQFRTNSDMNNQFTSQDNIWKIEIKFQDIETMRNEISPAKGGHGEIIEG